MSSSPSLSTPRTLTPPPPYEAGDSKPDATTKESYESSKNPAAGLGPFDVQFDPIPDLSLTKTVTSHLATATASTSNSKPPLSKKQVAKNYVMDFCYFPDDYDQRIAKYPDVQLKKQEAVKTRTCYSCMCSIISGSAFAVPSHGASAAICLWAARRWYVASKKLRFIRAELVKRKIELRPFLHRDWIIPASVAITCIAVGMGFDFGLAATVPLGHVDHSGLIVPKEPGAATQGLQHLMHITPNTATDPLLTNATAGIAPVDTTTVHQVVVGTHTGSGIAQQDWSLGAQDKLRMAMDDWGQGFKDQFQALFGSHHYGFSSGVTPDQTYEGAFAWLMGAESAQILEKEIADLLGQQVVQQVCERLDYESILPKYNHFSTCASLPWAVDTICSRCETGIPTGKFYHCCLCPGNNDGHNTDAEFNLCLDCHRDRPECKDPKHVLQHRQTALPGRVFLPAGKTTLMKDIAGPAKLSCSLCSVKITRGWYYDCLECRKEKKNRLLCLRCYETGNTCEGEETHNFYAFPRTKFASYSQDAPYQKRRGRQDTGQASCSECHVPILKGAFYHCSKCRGGNYDLCSECFDVGEHCLSNDHTLEKFYAWKYKRPAPKSEKSTWKCSNQQCLRPDRKDDFFFGCRHEDCDDRQYGLCPPCYFSDMVCPVKEHEVFKCVFE